MSALRLTVKFYRADYPPTDREHWIWHDAGPVPRVGDFVRQPRSDALYDVLAVTWVERDEVNLTISPRL
jgi:hypothetical protein